MRNDRAQLSRIWPFAALGLTLGLGCGQFNLQDWDPDNPLRALFSLTPSCLSGLMLGAVVGLRFINSRFQPWKATPKPDMAGRAKYCTSVSRVKLGSLLAVVAVWLWGAMSLAPVSSMLAAVLLIWLFRGYAAWDGSIDGKLLRIHCFYGLQWFSEGVVVRLTDSKPDPVAGFLAKFRKTATALPEGYRDDTTIARARTRRSQIFGLLCFGLLLALIAWRTPLVDASRWVSALFLSISYGFLALRVFYALHPSGVLPVSSQPQPLKRDNPCIQDQGPPVPWGIGVFCILMGGWIFCLFLVVLPLMFYTLAAQTLGCSTETSVLAGLPMLLALAYERRSSWFEFDRAGARLWKHQLRGPYQFSQAADRPVVALGLKTSGGQGFPVAFFDDGHHQVLTRRSAPIAQAWQIASQIADRLLIPAISPQLSQDPTEVGIWIRQGRWGKGHPDWPETLATRPPSPSPPLD